MSDELEQPVSIEEVAAAAGTQDLEIVCLECFAKPGVNANAPDGTPAQMEIAKAGEPFYIIKAGQWVKMTRLRAKWHVERSLSNDATHPLSLGIRTVEEMVLLAAQRKADLHAKADADAQKAKDAQAAADQAAADALAAATLRRSLLDKALAAGVIASSDEGTAFTNDDLTAKTAAAIASQAAKAAGDAVMNTPLAPVAPAATPEIVTGTDTPPSA